MIFRNNNLYWSGLEIACIIEENNKIIEYGLKPEHRIKYCRIVRRKINSRNRFYLQLILEGKPYQNPDNKIGFEEIGLDVGPSTIAIVGDTKAELKQFCSDLVPKQKEKRKLQRKWTGRDGQTILKILIRMELSRRVRRNGKNPIIIRKQAAMQQNSIES